MITDPHEFFAKGCGRCEQFATPQCSTRTWIEGLNALRRICLDMGLVEAAKWGQPCYLHAGRNIALIGAFRGDFRLSFMNADLLRDMDDVLDRHGPNSRTPSMIRFHSEERVREIEPVIRACLRQLMVHAEAGTKPAKVPREFDMPDELRDALDADPELAEAFRSLTPGRRNSYLVNLLGARQSATRTARIEKFRGRILAGKGALER